MIIDDNWATLQYLQQDGELLTFNNRYLIHRSGEILNLRKKSKQNPQVNCGHAIDYHTYRVIDKGIQRRIRIHRAVLSSFFPIPNEHSELNACHIDANPLNNNLDNLCWMSASHNSLHAAREGYLAVDPATRIGVFLDEIKVKYDG